MSYGAPPPGGPPPGDNPYHSPGQASGPPPPPPPMAEVPEVPGARETNSDARMWAMFCHLAALVLAVIGPLIIWLIKRDEYPFVDRHGKEALNFQLTILIIQFASIPFMFFFCIGMLISFFVIMGTWVFALVMSIIAALKANEGLDYRYPLSFRMIG